MTARTPGGRRAAWAADQRGLGLIELLVSLGLITLAVLGLDTLTVSMIRGNLSARLTDEATRAAQTKMELVRQAGFAAAKPGKAVEAVLDVTQPSAVVFVRETVITDGPLPNTRTVNVTMTWPDRGLRRMTFQHEVVQ